LQQKQLRSCDVAKMTITKGVRSNLAELLGVRRPATVSRIDRECIERVDGADCKRGQIWQRQEHSSLQLTRRQDAMTTHEGKNK